eukprot:scaffold68914_cov91-Phaeocystis_antarctica.AAC.1
MRQGGVARDDVPATASDAPPDGAPRNARCRRAPAADAGQQAPAPVASPATGGATRSAAYRSRSHSAGHAGSRPVDHGRAGRDVPNGGAGAVRSTRIPVDGATHHQVLHALRHAEHGLLPGVHARPVLQAQPGLP